MTEEAAGLRFDIFERIELPETGQSIKQLEDVELTPQISLFADEEQAILRGHLLLSGTYIGEDSRGGNRLEHAIPVEISLPMYRITNLEHIGVEIDNFDVDLLSSRKLNVTGVLSLQGIDSQSAGHAAGFGANQDLSQATFPFQSTSHAASDSTSFATSDSLSQLASDRTSFEASQGTSESAVSAFHTQDGREDLVADSAEGADSADHANFSEPERKVDAAIAGLEAESGVSERDELAESEREEQQAEIELAGNTERDEELFEEHEATLQEAVKIAFSSHKSADSSIKHAEDLEAILISSGEERTIEHSENTADHANPPEEELVAESGADWKNFLLSRETSEERQFSKLKMCIVQREETLDSIAEKYNLNPREIILFNRLGEQDIEEGQIIYIPESIL